MAELDNIDIRVTDTDRRYIGLHRMLDWMFAALGEHMGLPKDLMLVPVTSMDLNQRMLPGDGRRSETMVTGDLNNSVTITDEDLKRGRLDRPAKKASPVNDSTTDRSSMPRHDDERELSIEDENAMLRDEVRRLTLQERTLQQRILTAEDSSRNLHEVLVAIRRHLPTSFNHLTTLESVERLVREKVVVERVQVPPPPAPPPPTLLEIVASSLRRVAPRHGDLLVLEVPAETSIAELRGSIIPMAKQLQDRLRSNIVTAECNVVVLPEGTRLTTETLDHLTKRVGVEPAREKRRPFRVPAPVARAYAEAAAASFGTTPDVIARKRALRDACARRAECAGVPPIEVGQYLRCGSLLSRVERVYVYGLEWHVEIAFCDEDGHPEVGPKSGDDAVVLCGPISDVITEHTRRVSAPLPRGSRRDVGRVIGPWPGDDDLLLADAE